MTRTTANARYNRASLAVEKLEERLCPTSVMYGLGKGLEDTFPVPPPGQEVKIQVWRPESRSGAIVSTTSGFSKVVSTEFTETITYMAQQPDERVSIRPVKPDESLTVILTTADLLFTNSLVGFSARAGQPFHVYPFTRSFYALEVQDYVYGTVDISLATNSVGATLTGGGTRPFDRGGTYYTDLVIDKPGVFNLIVSDSDGVSIQTPVYVNPPLAQTLHWTGKGDGRNWSDEPNWMEKQTPRDGVSLVFSSSTSSVVRNDMSGLALTSIEILGTGSTFLGEAIEAGSITQRNGNNKYNLDTELKGSSTIAVDNGSLKVSGVLSGAGSLTVRGGGTVELTQINTYQGGTTVESGATVGLLHDNALGMGTLTLNGTLKAQDKRGVILSNAVKLNGTPTIGTGKGGLDIKGNVEVAAASTVTVQGASQLLFNPDQTIAGPGTLTLRTERGTDIGLFGAVNGHLVIDGYTNNGLENPFNVVLAAHLGPKAVVDVKSDLNPDKQRYLDVVLKLSMATESATRALRGNGALNLSGGSLELDGDLPDYTGEIALVQTTAIVKSSASRSFGMGKVKLAGNVDLIVQKDVGLSTALVVEEDAKLTVMGAGKLNFVPGQTISGSGTLTLANETPFSLSGTIAAHLKLTGRARLNGILATEGGRVDVLPGAVVRLNERAGAPSPELRGGGAIHVEGGSLISNVSHPDYLGDLTLISGRIVLDTDGPLEDVLGKGKLNLVGGSLSGDGVSAIDNDLRFNGNVRLEIAKKMLVFSGAVEVVKNGRVAIVAESSDPFVVFRGDFSGDGQLTFDGLSATIQVKAPQPSQVTAGRGVTIEAR